MIFGIIVGMIISAIAGAFIIRPFFDNPSESIDRAKDFYTKVEPIIEDQASNILNMIGGVNLWV